MTAIAWSSSARQTLQRGLQRFGRIGFAQRWPIGECGWKPEVRAVSRHEHEWDPQRVEPLGDLRNCFRGSARHLAAQNPARGRRSCRARWRHFPPCAPSLPKPRIVSSQSSAMIGSSSTISTSLGSAAKPLAAESSVSSRFPQIQILMRTAPRSMPDQAQGSRNETHHIDVPLSVHL